MQKNNNRNVLIAYKLEEITKLIVDVDKTNTKQALSEIDEAYARIENIATRFDLSTLRAIVHWMSLNTELEEDKLSEIQTLLINNSYSNWIETLSKILRKQEESLLPVLYKDLTTPNWLVRPSAPILKNVAEWLSEIESDDNLSSDNQIKPVKSEDEVSQTEQSINRLINEKVSKAKQDNEYALVNSNAFDLIDKRLLKNEFATEIMNYGLTETSFMPQNIVQPSVGSIESVTTKTKEKVSLRDNKINDEILTRNKELLNAFSEPTNSDTPENPSSVENTGAGFKIELTEIIQTLNLLTNNTSDVFSAKNNFSKQFSRLVVLTDKSKYEAIKPIAEWAQRNILLFEINPSNSIKRFIQSGDAWSWINCLNNCLNHNNESRCINELSDALTHKEWLEPVNIKELEALLRSVNDLINHEDNVISANTANSNAFIDTKVPELVEAPMTVDNTAAETSGLQLNWNNNTHPELLAVFLDETQHQISELSPLLNKISDGDSENEDLKTAARLSHTIMGGSAIVGITAMSEISSHLETILEHSMDNDLSEEILALLPPTGTCLHKLFEAVQTHGKEPKEFLSLLNSLSSYANNLDNPDKSTAHSAIETFENSSEQLLTTPLFDINEGVGIDNTATDVDVDVDTTINSSNATLENQTNELAEESVAEIINNEFSNDIATAYDVHSGDTDSQEESDELLDLIADLESNSDNSIELETKKTDLVEEEKKQAIHSESPLEMEAKIKIEKSPFQLNWNDDTHPELLMVYLEETPTQITQLIPLMHKVSEGTADVDEKHVASRMAHTIKGASAIVGITTLSEIAYRLETLLDHSKKFELPEDILAILPKVAKCVEKVFDAIQMQEEEPAEYYALFKQLDNFVSNIDEDESIELTAPVLPDFILNQNTNNDDTDSVESKPENNSDIRAEDDLSNAVYLNDDFNSEDFSVEVQAVISNEEVTEQTHSSSTLEQLDTQATETVQLEKLENKDDVKNILIEFDDIVMNLIRISSLSKSIETSLDEYSSEFQRFDLLSEISGYPELSILSSWCHENLTLFAKNNTQQDNDFIISGNVWSWIEYTAITLNNPDDMSHMSSLSAELMREEWAKPISLEELQTVLLALRHIEDIKINDSISSATDAESSAEDSNEVISWDKDVHPELLAIYFQETPEQINTVADLLQKLVRGESTVEDNKKASRIAHTIKGASGVLGLTSLVELTHNLEEILDYSIKNKIPEETAELLAEASDCMESLFENIQQKKAEPEELQSVVKRLVDFSSSINNESVATPYALSKKDLTTYDLEVDKLATEPQTLTNVDINENYIRVPISVIDKLLNMTGELVTTSSLVGDKLDKTLLTTTVIKSQDERVHNMLEELSQTITRQEKEQTNMFSSLENSNFDTLEMDSYNELQSVASLLSETILDSQEMDNTLTKQLSELHDNLRSLGKLNKDFSDVVLSSRMISISTIIPRLERIVRQTCRKTGKKAKLVVTGKHINIDTDILNGLVDPLLHMLRNSIDHGIELPYTRSKNNKEETGLIELSFERDGNNILMSLKDDGAGINPEVIYKKAIEKGLITPEQEFSKDDTINLILMPGFTTQEKVSDISGRGVGMDVVNTSVESLNGTLSITSELGENTSVNLTIPLTLITNTTLLVKADSNTVAIPTDMIEQIIYQEPKDAINEDNQYFVKYEGQNIEINSLNSLLAWSNEAIDFTKSYNLLMIRTSDNQIHAIHIDSIISSREMVVKSLSPWILPTKGVIGACHLNDGGVAPVINLATVVKKVYGSKKFLSSSMQAPTFTAPRQTPKILVVDDSLSNRKALSLIIEKTAFDVLTAVDGMDALQIMNENNIDLVFTDLEMPRMNGLELTQAIRAWNDKSETPIVMITSRTTNKHRELAKQAGVDDYLTKPVVTETLLASIDTWLKQTEAVEA